jgi:hypothetical protein
MKSLQQQVLESEEALKQFIQEKYKEAYNQIHGIKLATLWYRWVKNDKGRWYWEFNHLEDGHCPNPVPTPKHISHNQAWKGGKWAKSLVQLDCNNVVGHYLIFN